jgi:hypothetical protein
MMQRSGGRSTYPQVFIGDKHVGGSDDPGGAGGPGRARQAARRLSLRVALVQLRTPATHAEALAHVEPLIRQAAATGAKLIATPEGTNILQRDRAKLLPALCTEADDPVVSGLRALAARLGVRLLIGRRC